MKDMDKAVARISKALENGEKLAVFGDYDVDGITSTCLLTDYLRSRGADVTMHIPRRIEEGYGLGCDAIRALSESGVTLIVTVDCGITGVDETAYAATLGVDLVITTTTSARSSSPPPWPSSTPIGPTARIPSSTWRVWVSRSSSFGPWRGARGCAVCALLHACRHRHDRRRHAHGGREPHHRAVRA